MPVIDVHSHLFASATPLPRAALDDPMWDVSARIGGNFRVRAETGQLPRIEDYVDRMDEWGVDIVVVNNVALTCSGARAMNEYNANFIAQYPGRMLGIAAVPMAEGDAGARELEYAVKELGFKGGKIYPKIHGVPLDFPATRPLYEAASDLDVPILTHVTAFPDAYTGARGMDWMDHTSDNPMRMFDSGLMRDIPNLKFIFAHQAGGFVYYKESILSRKPELAPLFDRFYVDISPAVRFSAYAVQAAVEALGEDHVLFGIDYPWANLEAASQCVAHVRNMPLADELKDAILGGNAIKLLRL
jgi:predicted TIM-barrel fold metal-dependent hydrolase